MRNVPATSYLHLLEISRDGKRIKVALVFASGQLGNQLNWNDNPVMFGYLEAKPSSDGSYNLTLTLTEDGGERTIDLNFNANFLFDDQAFFGSVNNTADGIQLFADQEGGYPVYIYQDGQDYTKDLYNHLLNYNDWAIENGYPQVERSQITANSICEAFPQTAYYEL
jgi:hypothetical protein